MGGLFQKLRKTNENKSRENYSSMSSEERFLHFIQMFDGFEQLTFQHIVNKEFKLSKKFIGIFAKRVKAELFEAFKEDNIDMVIDFYGNDKKLFIEFEDRYYETKLQTISIKNNNFLLKCKNCHKLYTDWKYRQTRILKCPKPYNNLEQHESDYTFQPLKFIQFVRRKYKMSWREIYWKFWSFLYIFYCGQCN